MSDHSIPAREELALRNCYVGGGFLQLAAGGRGIMWLWNWGSFALWFDACALLALLLGGHIA